MLEKDREADRMVAVLQGSYLARVFPKTWYGIQERAEVETMTEAEKLKDQLLAKFKNNKR